MSAAPPPLWERLLGRALREEDRDAALGDLAEEFRARAQADGPRPARRWYRRQVLRSLAPALAARRSHRDPHGEGSMRAWLEARTQDVRFALRTLRRAPVFTVAVLGTLGLGIGAAAAVYTVVDRVLLRPLPYPEPDRLHMLHQARGTSRFWVSAPNWADWRDRLASFEELAAFSPDGVNAVVDGEPERIAVAEVSENFFRALGVAPALGRTFTGEEARDALPVAVVSDGLWRRRMGGDPGAPGTSLTLDGTAYRVVGVLPPGRPLPDDAEAWIPLRVDAPGWRTRRGIGWLLVLGRLAEGVTPEAARAEADAVGAALREAFPDANEGMGLAVTSLEEEIVGGVRTPLHVLLAGALLLLVAVGTSVGGLLVARAAARGPEVAIRTALGGGRGRLAGQFLTEGLVLAVLGGALGLAAARAALAAVVALAPPGVPRLDGVGLAGSTVAFAAAAAAVAAVGFGIVPLGHVLGRGPGRTGAGGRTGRSLAPRVRQGLVVAQVAAAFVLVAGAGLLASSFARLARVELGFEPRGVLVAGLPTVESSFESPGARVAWFRDVLERTRALPGVRAAALTNAVPLVNAGPTFSYELREPPADPDDRLLARYRVVTPGLFEALRMDFTRGRSFTAGEVEEGGPRAIVVDEAFARAHFPDRDPLGQEVGLLDAWWTVVGVVETPRDTGLRGGPERHLYVPMGRAPRQGMRLVLRTDGDPSALLPAVRAAVRAADPTQPLTPTGPLTRWTGEALARPRFTAAVLGFFAATTLLLAGLGLYGVLAYTVERRAREMGVRMAVGASGRQVRGLVVRQGLALVAVGSAAGLVAAWLAAPFLEALVFQLDVREPRVLVAAAALLAAVAAPAAWIPAARATRLPLRAVLSAE